MGLAAGIGAIGSAIGTGLGAVGSVVGPALGAVGGASGLASLASAGANVYGAVNKANTASSAANAQQQAYQLAAANLQPWMQGGQSALQQQMALLGLGGNAGGQQAAISALQQSPLYQSLYHNGQQALLANAAATGGLRGGNTETGLYNLGVNTLAGVYQNQLSNLSDLSKLGENAGALVGNNQIGAGTSQAAGILGTGNANNQIASSIAGLTGNQQLLNALGLGGGIQTTTSNIAGPSYNIAANSTPSLNLDTTLPSLSLGF